MSNGMFDGSVKILGHPDLIDHHKHDRLQPPTTVELDLTNFCSHKCPLCVGGRTNMVKMDNDQARKLIVELRDYGVKAIVFTGGGEPTEHPHAVELMGMARERGMDVGLITHGGVIAKTNIAGELVKICSWIRVSIDAGDSDTYRQTHGVDKFECVWSALEKLGSAANGRAIAATVGVGYLIGDKTIDGMLRAAQRAEERGADYIQFRPFVEEAASIQVTRVEAVISECRKLETPAFHIGYLDHKYSGPRLASRQYNHCHGSHFTSVVQADGNVPLCCLYRGQPDYYGGNVFETSFSDVWEGERLRNLRDIDVHGCAPLCRHDTLNELVEVILEPKDHGTFL